MQAFNVLIAIVFSRAQVRVNRPLVDRWHDRAMANTSDDLTAAGASQTFRLFATIFGLIFSLSLVWSLATPLMAVPDEPAHAIKAAAVVRGELFGTPSKTAGALDVTVPRGIANSASYPCFAFKPTITPQCHTQIAGATDRRLIQVSTSAGAYNPVFYLMAGIPSLYLSGDVALYGMRFVAALITSLFWASAVVASTFLGKRWTFIASVIAITPMALFLAGSINPNGLEVSSAASFFAWFLVLLKNSSGRALEWTAAGAGTLSGSVLVNGRSIAAVWLLLGVISAFAFVNTTEFQRILRRPAFWVGTGTIGIAAVFATLWLFRAGGITSGEPFIGAGTSPLTGFVTMLGQTFDYATGYIGMFGWLDRPAPTATFAVWGALLIAAAVAMFAKSRPHMLFRLSVPLAFLVIAPAVVQAAAVTQFGYIWQGRYAFALFVVVVIATGYGLDQNFAAARFGPLSLRAIKFSIGLVVATHFLAFFTALHRYVVGDGTTFFRMVLSPTWQPPLGWLLISLLFLALSASSGVLFYRFLFGGSRFRPIASR